MALLLLAVCDECRKVTTQTTKEDKKKILRRIEELGYSIPCQHCGEGGEKKMATVCVDPVETVADAARLLEGLKSDRKVCDHFVQEMDKKYGSDIPKNLVGLYGRNKKALLRADALIPVIENLPLSL